MEGDVIPRRPLRLRFEGEEPQGNIKGNFKSSGLRPHFLPKSILFRVSTGIDGGHVCSTAPDAGAAARRPDLSARRRRRARPCILAFADCANQSKQRLKRVTQKARRPRPPAPRFRGQREARDRDSSIGR